MLTTYLIILIALGLANTVFIVMVLWNSRKAKPAAPKSDDIETLFQNQKDMWGMLQNMPHPGPVTEPVVTPKEVSLAEITKTIPLIVYPPVSNGNGNGNGHKPEPAVAVKDKPEKTPEEKAAFAKRLADGKAKAKAKREAEAKPQTEAQS